ncbi:3-oxoacyl-[acyl-carrier-protein] reductase [Xiamenia xianingshaonis]|uniref:3-oxoacyl-[acyl-carrier-protein] reductase n=1 Tax=Xiamenia xianingshaonis TaxID=2682776 RepID=A0A9E6MPU1_9ACTN|nr:3-oxoacyl-[acyl-carrier-protein] reductase [Xiamenia xianingshaonis]NHM14724.1 3-oxoacyl-[acyl-carrier-protein] reductase [Xiamenia xianingshaonis]QTU83772.1 3-oxoacyl-[acyl-carrier-protein] reductase [Xiamenia xianingshaonis]
MQQPALTGASALVTGSSRGIGAAIARALAAQGANVCLNCSSEAGLQALAASAAELEREFGVKTCAVVGNVADPEDAKRLANETIDAFGTLDVLVNNAGITRDGLAVRMSDDDFAAVIDVNLKGTFNCCRAAVKPMMKQRRGRIVNLSSVVGIAGNAGQANYAASKAGVIGLTKSLAKELGSRNITVNAIAPGFIETDMTDALSDKQRDGLESAIALRRLGQAEEVAALAAFLASDSAAYITGQVIAIDGGMSL